MLPGLNSGSTSRPLEYPRFIYPRGQNASSNSLDVLLMEPDIWIKVDEAMSKPYLEMGSVWEMCEICESRVKDIRPVHVQQSFASFPVALLTAKFMAILVFSLKGFHHVATSCVQIA